MRHTNLILAITLYYGCICVPSRVLRSIPVSLKKCNSVHRTWIFLTQYCLRKKKELFSTSNPPLLFCDRHHLFTFQKPHSKTPHFHFLPKQLPFSGLEPNPFLCFHAYCQYNNVTSLNALAIICSIELFFETESPASACSSVLFF